MVKYVRNDGSTICKFKLNIFDPAIGELLDRYGNYDGGQVIEYCKRNCMEADLKYIIFLLIKASIYECDVSFEDFQMTVEYSVLVEKLIRCYRLIDDFLDKITKPNCILTIVFDEDKEETVMPTKSIATITIERIVVHNNKVMIVYFSDDTYTKAICSDNDTFNFDIAYQVCLLKKMLGNSQYHKAMRDAKKLYEKQEQEKKELIEQKRQRRAAQEARHQKNLARANKQREQFKNDISEAVLAAISEVNIDIYDATKDEINTEGDDLK